MDGWMDSWVCGLVYVWLAVIGVGVCLSRFEWVGRAATGRLVAFVSFIVESWFRVCGRVTALIISEILRICVALLDPVISGRLALRKEVHEARLLEIQSGRLRDARLSFCRLHGEIEKSR